MTIAIGINLNYYAILAADTRVTYMPSSGTPFYDDNSTKVQKTKMGLITGAGFCPLLDAVKERLAGQEVSNTDQILTIIKEETEKISIIWRNYLELQNGIKHTGWIFSYITSKQDQPSMRVSLFHPSVNTQGIGLFEIGKPAIIYPVELKPEVIEDFHEIILKAIKIPANSSEIQNSIENNTLVIAQIITSLQPSCSSISKRFQIGIHYGNQTGISGLIDIQNDGKYSFNIKLES